MKGKDERIMERKVLRRKMCRENEGYKKIICKREGEDAGEKEEGEDDMIMRIGERREGRREEQREGRVTAKEMGR